MRKMKYSKNTCKTNSLCPFNFLCLFLGQSININQSISFNDTKIDLRFLLTQLQPGPYNGTTNHL